MYSDGITFPLSRCKYSDQSEELYTGNTKFDCDYLTVYTLDCCPMRLKVSNGLP